MSALSRRFHTPRKVVRATCCVVESFEPRTLLSIAVTVGTGAARAVNFTDADGTATTVRATNGTAAVVFDGTNLSQTTTKAGVAVAGTGVTMTGLSVAGPNPGVLITTKGGDGKATLGGINAPGPVRAISGPGVVLTGATTLGNGIGSLNLGGVQDATLTITRAGLARLQDAALSLGAVQDTVINSQQPFRQLRVASWAPGSGAIGNSITTLRVNTIQSAGDFASDLALSGNGQAVGAPVLGNTRVGGALAAGNWNVAGKTGRVAAGSVGNGWSGTFGNLASLAVAGDLAGNVTADSINSVTANTITGARITLNQAFAPGATALNRLSAGGAITNTRVRSTGNIGTVSALSMTGSTIFAGIDTSGGPPNRLPSAATAFTNGATIRGVTLRNRGAAIAYAGSNIAAATLGRINLGTVQLNNGGTPFGLAAQTITSLSATRNDTGAQVRGLRLTDPSQSVIAGDAQVRVF